MTVWQTFPLSHLNALLEAYYRMFPELRGREEAWWFLDEIPIISALGKVCSSVAGHGKSAG